MIYSPVKLTWNLKISPWKRRFLWKTIIFRFHVSFRGCILPEKNQTSFTWKITWKWKETIIETELNLHFLGVPSQFSGVSRWVNHWDDLRNFPKELCEKTITGRSDLCLLRMVRWIGELWSPSSLKQHKISGMKSQTGMVNAKVGVVDWTTKENGKKKWRSPEACVHTNICTSSNSKWHAESKWIYHPFNLLYL